uniref:Uncharacterized protein n=1 Tax=Cucumis melo TaxID=3656 RepID=A0A9I9CF96_CUCME
MRNMKMNTKPEFATLPLNSPKSPPPLIPQHSKGGTNTSAPKKTSLPEWRIEEELFDHISNNTFVTNTRHSEHMEKSIPNKDCPLTIPKNMVQSSSTFRQRIQQIERSKANSQWQRIWPN